MSFKFWVFEESAVTALANSQHLQSIEFRFAKEFINLLQGKQSSFSYNSLFCHTESSGLIMSGKGVSEKILVFDLSQCNILSAEEDDLLFILQKSFRTAIRIWNGYPLTSSEKLLKDHNIVLFPFPFSRNSKDSYRIVFQIEANNSKASRRGIDSAIIAYKYGTEGAARGPLGPDEKITKLKMLFFNKKGHLFENSTL